MMINVNEKAFNVSINNHLPQIDFSARNRLKQSRL